jgi:hypothetical protein
MHLSKLPEFSWLQNHFILDLNNIPFSLFAIVLSIQLLKDIWAFQALTIIIKGAMNNYVKLFV